MFMKGILLLVFLFSLSLTGCATSGCQRNYVISGEDGPVIVKPSSELK